MDDDVFGDSFDVDTTVPQPTDSDGDSSASSGSAKGGGGAGGYASELVSKKISGRQRTFFLDLKESSNGKFIKISELSRGGQRSTIMFDSEDIDSFIEALQELKAEI